MSKELETEKLAYMQGQRYFMEQPFKESKNQAAIGDYQIRSWIGTQRHLTCSMFALNFLMEQRHQCAEEYKNITIPDIVRFISLLIPVKLDSVQKMFDHFINKHDQYTHQIKLANQKKHQTPE